MYIKVAAIVVTFNRKEMLHKCLISLLNQTMKINKVYIIDNASTDGTKDYLIQKGLLEDERISYIRLEKNTGGAGGFYYGLKKAHEEGYDYFYLMDDDGMPRNDALERLICDANKYSLHYINSLVIDNSNHAKLSFSLNYNGRVIREIKDINAIKEDIIIGSANPFNGLLLTKEIVDKVGYPKKEMFIWGDEVEYKLRVEKAGYRVATSLNSIHYHPSAKGKIKKIIFNSKEVSIANGVFRTYIKHRNKAYIDINYLGKIALIKWIFKYSWFFIISEKGNWKMLKTMCVAIIDGIKGKFIETNEILQKLKISSINE